MVTRYEAELNGKSLHDLGENIIITDICETAPALGVATMTNAGYDGQRVLRQYRNNLQVSITFAIEEYAIKKRKQVCRAVSAWAINGGVLKVNDRPDQHLNVICTQPPVVQSAQRWLDSFTVVFTAYAMPYWEDDSTQDVVIDASAANVTTNKSIVVDGDGKCFVECSVKNTDNKAMTAITLKAGASTIKLSGISVAKNSTIDITYDANHLISIKNGKTSMMGKRVASSSDDLCVEGGKNTKFSVNASCKCEATYKVRGVRL